MRRRVQAARAVDDAALLGLLTDTFDTEQLQIPAWTAPLQSVLRAYWRVFRGLIGTGAPADGRPASGVGTGTHGQKAGL